MAELEPCVAEATPQGDLVRLAALLRTTGDQLAALAPLLASHEAARLCDQLEGPAHDLGAVLETWNRRQGN